MLAIVETPGLEWVQAFEWVPWLLGYLALFAAVLTYPWPAGVRCRVLQWGLGLMLLNQIVMTGSRLGVLGPPRFFFNEPDLPGWLGALDLGLLMALGVAGGIGSMVGAWWTARDLVRTWSGATSRKGGRGA